MGNEQRRHQPPENQPHKSLWLVATLLHRPPVPLPWVVIETLHVGVRDLQLRQGPTLVRVLKFCKISLIFGHRYPNLNHTFFVKLCVTFSELSFLCKVGHSIHIGVVGTTREVISQVTIVVLMLPLSSLGRLIKTLFTPTRLTRRQPERVNPDVGIAHIGNRVGRGFEPKGVRGGVAAGLRVVVAKVVVVQAGFWVVVLAGEAEWGVRGAVRGPCRGAPQGAAGAPGYVARLVDEFGRGADQVRDYGE